MQSSPVAEDKKYWPSHKQYNMSYENKRENKQIKYMYTKNQLDNTARL